MEEHVATMQELVDKLTALGEEIKDPLFVAMLLSSLPESYSTNNCVGEHTRGRPHA